MSDRMSSDPIDDRSEAGPSPEPEPPNRSQGLRYEGTSFFEIANTVLRNRRLIVVCMFLAASGIAVYTLVQPRTFTSEASFVVEAADERPQIAQMAQRFGMTAPGGGDGESPAFYTDLLRSRELLGRVADTTFFVRANDAAFPSDTVEGRWMDIFDIEGKTAAIRRELAIKDLQERISVTTDDETAVVELEVATPWPRLSYDVADLLVKLVNDYNLDRRQSKAATERAFVSGRLEEAREELRNAEEALEAFLEHNRQYQQSPALVFEVERLERQVMHRQEVVTSLTQSYEEARIDEVRTTPVVSPVVEPYVAAIPDSRRLLLRTVLGLLAGSMLGVLVAFGREFFLRVDAEDDEDAREFARLRREVGAEMRNPLRLVFPARAGEAVSPLNGRSSESLGDQRHNPQRVAGAGKSGDR